VGLRDQISSPKCSLPFFNFISFIHDAYVLQQRSVTMLLMRRGSSLDSAGSIRRSSDPIVDQRVYALLIHHSPDAPRRLWRLILGAAPRLLRRLLPTYPTWIFTRATHSIARSLLRQRVRLSVRLSVGPSLCHSRYCV